MVEFGKNTSNKKLDQIIDLIQLISLLGFIFSMIMVALIATGVVG